MALSPSPGGSRTQPQVGPPFPYSPATGRRPHAGPELGARVTGSRRTCVCGRTGFSAATTGRCVWGPRGDAHNFPGLHTDVFPNQLRRVQEPITDECKVSPCVRERLESCLSKAHHRTNLGEQEGACPQETGQKDRTGDPGLRTSSLNLHFSICEVRMLVLILRDGLECK